MLAEIVLVVLSLSAPVTDPQVQPRFYYGADCAAENKSAGSPTADGIVLEGGSGAVIASGIACADRPALFQALQLGFRGPVGDLYRWQGAAKANSGSIRSTWEFRNHDVVCRDFALDHMIGGHRYLRQGTACLEADGNWHLH
jgi:surface antigen